MSTTREHAGSAVRVIREALSLEREQLAGLASVDQGYLSRVEAGERQPSPRWLREVQQALVAETLRRRGGAA